MCESRASDRRARAGRVANSGRTTAVDSALRSRGKRDSRSVMDRGKRTPQTGKKRREGSDRLRNETAQMAARIMAEEGVHDFHQAKVKAVRRLGLNVGEARLPRNEEIHEALFTYQRLFQANSQPALLRRLRECALNAMDLLKDFSPRLTGSVLCGTANKFSEVNLHLFAEPAEQVAWFLIECNIPFESDSRQYRYPGQRSEELPIYRFLADGIRIDLTVFSLMGLRQSPSSAVDGRPMHRASRDDVELLLIDQARE